MGTIHKKFGSVIKRETLCGAGIKGVRELVLTSSDPFPGYYCEEEVPADNSCKAHAFYFPVTYVPGFEDAMCRLSSEIQRQTGYNVCAAKIQMADGYSGAFRVKETAPEHFPEIVSFFKKKGVKFMMKKEVKTFLSHITLRSFFYVEEISKGIYRNDESEGLFYLETSHETDWPVFEKLITYQKLTGDFRNFDAAIGYWIDKPAFIDFIRIYSRSIDTMKLAEIRNTYHRNMEDLLEKRIMI